MVLYEYYIIMINSTYALRSVDVTAGMRGGYKLQASDREDSCNFFLYQQSPAACIGVLPSYHPSARVHYPDVDFRTPRPLDSPRYKHVLP